MESWFPLPKGGEDLLQIFAGLLQVFAGLYRSKVHEGFFKTKDSALFLGDFTGPH